MIWGSAAFAGWESYRKLVSHQGTAHLGVGMLAAVVGMVGNLAVSRYKAHVARRIQSLTLEAEARHSWLDVISSFGALLGLAGVAFCRWVADPIAGFFVTLFICHVGYEIPSQIVHHLMDGVDAEHLSTAETAARSVSGVRSAMARGRWMGRSLMLDIEGEMDAKTILVHATEIGRRVEDAVRAAVPEVRQVRWIPVAPPLH